MKKLLSLALILTLSSSTAFSAELKDFSLKSFFDKKPAQAQKNKPDIIIKPSMQLTESEDSMTPSQQANLYYSSNDIKKAFEILLTIKEGERTVQDWLLMGNILQDQKKSTEAIFMYERAILLNPKYYKAYYNLANIYLEDEKPFLAIENYKKSNKYNNTFAYGYYNLGCAYIQAGDLKAAKIAFLKAIELKNNEPDFYYNLAYTYKKLNKPELSKQYLEFYNKALENQGG